MIRPTILWLLLAVMLSITVDEMFPDFLPPFVSTGTVFVIFVAFIVSDRRKSGPVDETADGIHLRE